MRPPCRGRRAPAGPEWQRGLSPATPRALAWLIDHTGPVGTGTRRRIGLNSTARFAKRRDLARFRDGVMLPREPLVRRMAHDEKVDLYSGWTTCPVRARAT